MNENKKLKQPLYLKGYETNPHGNQVPIYTTVKPVEKVSGVRSPLFRKKEK